MAGSNRRLFTPTQKDWPHGVFVYCGSPNSFMEDVILCYKQYGLPYSIVDDGKLHEGHPEIQAHRKTGIFVVEKLRGDVFHTLVQTKCRIITPMCILSCAAAEQALPNRRTPTASCAMRGIVACCTSLPTPERNGIHKKIELMDGRVVRDFTKDVTHLIAPSWGSEKCRVALDMKILIMMPSWVDKVWKDSETTQCVATEVKYLSRFKLKTFHKCQICITGIPDLETRTEIERKTVEYGGVYSSSCHDTVTHLLAAKPSGPKYEYAVQNGNISIVSVEWLWKSIEAGGPCRIEQFSVAPTKTNAGTSINASDVEVKQPTNFYFDGLSFYLTNLDTTLLKLMIRIIRAGGGVRYEALNDKITHVIHGGSGLSPEDERYCRQHGISPCVLPCDWVVSCNNSGTVVSTAPYDKIDSTSDRVVHLPMSRNTGSSLKAKTVIDEGFTSMFDDSWTVPKQNPIPNKAQGDIDDGPDSRAKENLPHGLLKGLRFHLHPQWIARVPPEEKTDAVHTVVQCGGAVVDTEADVTECDILLTDLRHASLPSNIAAKSALTLSWLERCITENKLLDPSSNFLFTPVQWDATATPFKDTQLCFTGFSEDVKVHLQELCTLVKAKTTGPFYRKRTTHVICASASGDKYVRAYRVGIPTVSVHWLFDCTASKCLLPTSDYDIRKQDGSDIQECDLDFLHAWVKETSTRNSQSKATGKDKKSSLNATMCQKLSPSHKNVVAAEFGDLSTPQRINVSSPTSQLADKSIERNFSLNLRKITSMTAKQHGQSSGVLKGVTVCISSSKKLDSIRHELLQLSRDLGAGAVLDGPSGCTHYVFQGKPNDTYKEFRSARTLDCAIVSPTWLWCAKETGVRPRESLYPHSYDPNRALLHSVAPPLAASGPTSRPQLSRADEHVEQEVTLDLVEAPFSVENREDSTEQSPTTNRRDSIPLMQSPNMLEKAIETLMKVPGQRSGGRFASRSKSSGDGDAVETDQERILSRHHSDRVDVSVELPDATFSKSNSGVADKHNSVDDIDFDGDEDSSQIAVTYADPGQDARRRMLAKLQHGLSEALASPSTSANDSAKDSESVLEDVAPESVAPPCFLLSALEQDQKLQLTNAIEDLGGTVVDTQTFDTSCSHVVVGGPSRSEKYLAACAAGKWILQPKYIATCLSHGHFVDEIDYEWTDAIEVENLDDTKRKLLAAPRRWRLHMEDNKHGAFHNWRVVLFIARVEGFKRLLEAGEAIVYKSRADIPPNESATHVFFEPRMYNKYESDILAFEDSGTHCLKTDYISEYLTSPILPSVDDFSRQSGATLSLPQETRSRKRSTLKADDVPGKVIKRTRAGDK
eukprot:m.790910 g.790910  ORF g.790910 m.790910 type:complete len:1330 (+) comp23328_c0_seq1:102-4091(+)